MKLFSRKAHKRLLIAGGIFFLLSAGQGATAGASPFTLGVLTLLGLVLLGGGIVIKPKPA